MHRLLALLFLISFKLSAQNNTTICKWQGNKKAAISITYDDGIINQFTVARPIMNALNFRGTYFVITGKLDNAGKGKFVGRPIKELIIESENIKTDASNFFERASAIAFSGVPNAVYYHTRAGSLFESGRASQAYNLLDEGYAKLRNAESIISDEIIFHDNVIDTSTWEDFRNYIKEGHEIASHTVTHPKLAVLDEPNMLYELEQSKADIERELGKASTFSAEGPYGTENERVMEYAHKIYPALRNRMPEDWLEEINRGSKMEPSASEKEYVQWQRGPVNSVNMEKMKAWVDTSLAHDNVWLVLVFHGIDGVGWEPRTGSELKEYFGYMKSKESDLWIDTFGIVTKYLRERKATNVTQKNGKNKIVINLASDLDADVYNVPLTLKTYLPENWQKVHTSTGVNLNIQNDKKGHFVIYETSPSVKEITLKKV